MIGKATRKTIHIRTLSCDHPECNDVTNLTLYYGRTADKADIAAEGWTVTDDGKHYCPACAQKSDTERSDGNDSTD